MLQVYIVDKYNTRDLPPFIARRTFSSKFRFSECPQFENYSVLFTVIFLKTDTTDDG